MLVYSTSSGETGPPAPTVLPLDSGANPSCAMALVLLVKLLEGPALYSAAILGDSLTGLCTCRTLVHTGHQYASWPTPYEQDVLTKSPCSFNKLGVMLWCKLALCSCGNSVLFVHAEV